MANVKITELAADTNPASTDVLPFVDVDTDETKKVTIADLLENAGDGSAAAPGIAFDGDSNTGIYRPGADQFAISIGGSEAARFDGDGRLLIGTTNATDNIRTQHKLAIVYAGNNTYTGAGFTGYSGTLAAAAPFLEIQRSRGTTDGDLTRVNNGDRLGSLNFRGADGTNFIAAANIACEVDNAAGTNDMPGRLVFAVTANGASSTTEALRITNDRYVRLASGSGGIQFNGDTAAANALDDYEEGTWTPSIEATTGAYATMNVDIIRATYTKIGRLVQVQAFIRTDDVDTTGGSDALKVTGLPFSANSAANARQLGSPLLMEYNNNAAYSGTYAAHQAGGGGDAIVFKEVSAGSIFAAASDLEGSQLQQGTSTNRNWMSFSLQYFTD